MQNLKTEASYLARRELQSLMANWVLATSLVGATYGTFKLPFEYKYLAGLGGLGLSVAGLMNCRNGQELKRAGGDLRNVSDMARTTRYYEETRPNLELFEEPPKFDWSMLRDKPDLYPHAILVGASGGGKSSFAENLAGLLQGNSYGIIPHWQHGEFTSCIRVWGDENNLGMGAGFDRKAFKPRTSLEAWEDMLKAIPVQDGSDPIVTWLEITEGVIPNPTACQVFRAIWFEMRRRYKKGADGKFLGGRRINLIADEFNAMANLPGLRNVWLEVVREARKVGIALILIVQQNDVTSLNIEGQGGIRENLTKVAFNSAADEVILNNVSLSGDNKHLREYWLAKYREYQLKNYRATVEFDWCELPYPGTWVKSVVTRMPQESLEIVDTTQATREVSQGKLEYSREELEEFKASAVKAANEGETKAAIINKVWGFRKNWKDGLNLWRRIESELGTIVLLPQQVKKCNDSLHVGLEGVIVEE